MLLQNHDGDDTADDSDVRADNDDDDAAAAGDAVDDGPEDDAADDVPHNLATATSPARSNSPRPRAYAWMTWQRRLHQLTLPNDNAADGQRCNTINHTALLLVDGTQLGLLPLVQTLPR